jgi:hypothetical protein
MDITDYNAMLCAIDTVRNLKEPFEKRAAVIASNITGLHPSEIMSVFFGESKVTYTWGNEYSREVDEASFPVDWLFDPDWVEKHKAENETKRRAWEERMKKYGEQEQKQKDDRERVEYERLRTKFEGPRP